MRVSWRPVALGIAVLLGLALGAAYRFRESVPPTSFLPSTLVVVLALLAVLGLLGIGVLVSAVRQSTRPVARSLVLFAAALIVGLPAGYVAGPTATPERDLAGVVEIQLTGATGARFAGDATCRTVFDSEVIKEITATGIGSVDGHSLRVIISWLDPVQPEVVITLMLGGGDDVSGLLTDVEVGENRWSGRASFANLQVDHLDPDPPGGWSNPAGSVTWSCR